MDSRSLDSQARGKIKIKTVSTYEVLDATGNRVSLDLKQKWAQYKNSSATSKVLVNYFESSSNPYVAALQMMVNAQDFCLSKQNSLAIFVVQTFSKWKVGKEGRISHMLTNEIKFDAFNLLMGQRNLILLGLVVKEFKLVEDKMKFIQPLKKFLNETKNYKETCDWALALHLYDHFSLEDFVLPLLLQGKFQVAQIYLEKSKNLRIPMITFLDSLLINRYTEAELANVANQLKVNEVKLNQLGYKSVCKLLTKLLKVFGLPSSLAPNLVKSKGRGALSFLLHKKFIEKSISPDGWAEMVVEAVQSDASLQMELVAGVTAHGDLKNAYEWAVKFNVPKHKWPFRLQQFVDRDNMQSTSQWYKQEWEEPSSEDIYHKLSIPESNIVLVDTISGLESFLNELANNNVKLVGLDAEWKPTFGFKRCDLALVQIATKDKVFIIDVVALASDLPKPRERLDEHTVNIWSRFANSFFGNPTVTKLGFGMGSDLSAIKDIIRKRGITKTPEMGFLDMSMVALLLIEQYKFVFPYTDPKSNISKANSEECQMSISLSNLVKMALGKALNKSDQFSNWERRPLRRDQIIYAALDAFCLIEVYDLIGRECERQNIPLDEVINTVRNLNLHHKKSKKRLDSEEEQEEPRPPVHVSEFRVLCDKTLVDLGKLLRKCGVDTIIADMKQNIQEAEVDGSVPLYIVTQRPDHARFNYLGDVYCVKNRELKDQIFEVLSYFNVKVSEEDLHTRCKECNSPDFEQFTKEELQALDHAQTTAFAEYPSRFYDDVTDVTDLPGLCCPGKESTIRYRTKNGIVVRYSEIPQSVLKHNSIFLVCTACGKCYWDGNQKEPRHEKVLKDIVAS